LSKALIRELEEKRDLFRQVIAGLTEKEAQRPLGSGDWTIRSVLAHLASAEGAQRIVAEIMVAKKGYNFKPLDRDEWNAAEIEKRKGRPLAEIVSEWEENRQKFIDFFSGLNEEQLAYQGTHPLWGDITTQFIAEQLLRHQAEHQAEISAARRNA
jgi:uncharacterized damage-inducible protein DinB